MGMFFIVYSTARHNNASTIFGVVFIIIIIIIYEFLVRLLQSGHRCIT